MLVDRCDPERQMRRFVRVVADFSVRLVERPWNRRSSELGARASSHSQRRIERQERDKLFMHGANLIESKVQPCSEK